jgi:hypothetical protein
MLQSLRNLFSFETIRYLVLSFSVALSLWLWPLVTMFLILLAIWLF